MSEQPLAVRVPLSQDKYVRSLPNKTEWLRQAIAEKYARDLQEKGAQEQGSDLSRGAIDNCELDN